MYKRQVITTTQMTLDYKILSDEEYVHGLLYEFSID